MATFSSPRFHPSDQNSRIAGSLLARFKDRIKDRRIQAEILRRLARVGRGTRSEPGFQDRLMAFENLVLFNWIQLRRQK